MFKVFMDYEKEQSNLFLEREEKLTQKHISDAAVASGVEIKVMIVTTPHVLCSLAINKQLGHHFTHPRVCQIIF